MLTEREKKILRYLAEVKFAKVEQLSAVFGVSVETIRRDLLDLERDASIKRVRGGAIYNAMRAKEIEFDKKLENNQQEKLAIVRAAVECVRDSEAIMLSNGSINIMLARELAQKRSDLTIITNSLDAAMILNKNASHKVIVTGGELRKHNQSMVGSVCLDCLDHFHADKAIVNVDGISLENGVTEFNIEEAAVIRKMLSMSQTRVVLCDYGRFSEIVLNRVCTIDTIDIVFTDWNIPLRQIKEWEDAGIKIVSAEKA